jgi:hypothetical protein
MSSDGPAEPSPWLLISEQPKFDCQYFTARADMVSHSGGRARTCCYGGGNNRF